MRILGLDTTGLVASVALADETAVLGEVTTNCKKNHSETIMPMVAELFTRLELDISEIDYIACTNGPGSFTGLRIGAATAKALAHATGKKIVPVPTLDALAYNLYDSSKLVVPMMDARRGQVYTAFYEGGIKRLTDYMAIPLDEVLELLKGYGLPEVFLGDGAAAHAQRLAEYALAPPHLRLQRAAAVAALGLELAAGGHTVGYDGFEMFYLRKPQAEREYEARRGGLS